MAEYNKTILTNDGIELMRKANAGKTKFTITKVVGSSANLSSKSSDELKKLTTLSDIKQNGTIKDIEGTALDNNTVMALKLTFDNRNLANAYTLNTIGIYAKEEGKEEFLYAISTAKSAENFPSFSNKVLFYFDVLVYLVIGQADFVTVNVSPEKVEEQIKELKENFNSTIIKERDRTYSKAEVDEKVSKAGAVKTVNQIVPDASGNVAIDPSISVVKSYNFDTDSATSEYSPASKAFVIGRNVLVDIKNRLNAVKSDLDKKISDETYSKSEIDNKVAQAGKVKKVDNTAPDTDGNVNLTVRVRNIDSNDIKGGSNETRDLTNTTFLDFRTLTTIDNVINKLKSDYGKTYTVLNDQINDKAEQSDVDNKYDELTSKITANSTNITSNTNRISALEKKETSHLSNSESEALTYSKAHPGIPVFVTEA